jgi:hypothetical protein
MNHLARRAGAVLIALVAFVLAPLSRAFGLPLLPAGTMTATTNISEAMKIIFSDPIVQNMVVESELLNRFRTETNVRTDDTTGGRYIEMAHYFQLPAGVGARQENEYIPVADAPVFRNSRIWLAKIQGVVEMTGDVMRRVASNEGAFLDYAAQALPDFSRRLTHEIDRMVLGVGTGVKARIRNVTATLGGVPLTAGISAFGVPAAGQFVIAVDRTMGIAGLGQSFLHFLEGERLTFTAALALPSVLKNAGTGQSAQVISINEDENTLTLQGLVGLHAALAANDYIAAGDSAGTSLPGLPLLGSVVGHKEIQGLYAGVDNGGVLANYNNIDRTNPANRLWNSIVIDGSAAPWTGVLNEELMVYADDEVAVRGAGRVDLIVTSRSGARGYWKSLKTDRFFMDPRSYAGGKPGVQVILGDRSLPLVIARKLPYNTTFMLQSDTWRRLTLGTWEWDDKTGSIWNRVSDAVGRRDAYFAVGNGYEQLFNTAPRKNVRIDNLSLIT